MNTTNDKPFGSSSDVTRRKLVDAGLRLFAEFGVEGVRTRVLADAAGVNQAAIPYHFGGKEGVYSAVVEETVKEIAEGLGKTGLMNVTAEAIQAMPADACRDHLQALVRAFALLILAPGRPRERTALIVREQLQPTGNFNVLFNGFIAPLHSTVSALVARLSLVDLDGLTAVIKAHAIIGQVLAFAVAQNSYLLRAQQQAISIRDAEHIADTLSDMAVKSLSH
jgi:AcrR family transcriptional regulator